MVEQYIVSARKYRPQTFDTVVGQQHITTTLKNAIRHNHLAHAYLFCGPRGVGKTTCARILAKTINCENPTLDMEACGICNTCRSFASNTSFNVFELDAASNNSVDDIRELINQVRFAPQAGRYKVYIIDEVHMLSQAAFNAFLKTLEEPPPYAIFILATTEKHKILPTILSRCQIFDFKRITTEDIVLHLQEICAKEGLQAQEAALHVIAQKSEGCMRDALSMLDRIASFTEGQMTYSNTMEHLNLLDADFYFALVDNMLSQDVSGTLLLLDKVLEKGFEGDVIINGLAEHMRNLLLCKDARMAKLLDVPNEHKPVYAEKAQQAPPAFIISSLNVLNDTELNYKNALNKRLHIELCLIRLCYVLQATHVAGNQSVSLTDDVKKNTNWQPPVAPKEQPAEQTPAPAPKREEPVSIQEFQHSVRNEEPSLPVVNEPPVYQKDDSITKRVQEPEVPIFPPPGSGKPGGARRLSKTIIEVDTTAGTNTEKKELTRDAVIAAFEKYKQQAQQENKTVLYVQMGLVQLEVLPPDEVCIVCPTDFAFTIANGQRDALIEYFRQETGVSVLRVTTTLKEDPEMTSNQPTVLSRQEIFEAMAKKNPYLGQLKDGLNLQIDY